MKRIIACMLSLVMLILLFAACSPKAASNTTDAQNANSSASNSGTTSKADEGKPSYKDTVVIDMAQPVLTPDVQGGTDPAAKVITKMIHRGLVFFEGDAYDALPGVAETWEQTGEKTYLFHLRQGMKFHNGEEVKASDVVYTYGLGKDKASTKSVLGRIAEIKAVDDYTVEITLSNVDVDYIMKLSDPLYGILSEKEMTKDPEKGAYIGCGPYVLDEFVLNDHVSMHKFEDYYDAENLKTNHFIFRYIPESSARLIALQNGEIDVCMGPAAIELPYIEEDKNLVLKSINSNNFYFLGINMENPVMQNEKLREAIACALNKEEILMIAGENLGIVSDAFWFEKVIGYKGDVDAYKYDLDKAKKLLEEAGYPNGLELEIACLTSIAPSVQIIQSQLQKIGITVSINEMDRAGLNNYMSQNSHQIMCDVRGLGQTIEGIRKMLITGGANNWAHYSNARVDELFEIAGSTTDVATRETCYHEVQDIVAKELPYIPIYNTKLYWATNKNFDGIMTHPGNMLYYAYSYVTE